MDTSSDQITWASRSAWHDDKRLGEKEKSVELEAVPAAVMLLRYQTLPNCLCKLEIPREMNSLLSWPVAVIWVLLAAVLLQAFPDRNVSSTFSVCSSRGWQRLAAVWAAWPLLVLLRSSTPTALWLSLIRKS